MEFAETGTLLQTRWSISQCELYVESNCPGIRPGRIKQCELPCCECQNSRSHCDGFGTLLKTVSEGRVKDWKDEAGWPRGFNPFTSTANATRVHWKSIADALTVTLQWNHQRVPLRGKLSSGMPQSGSMPVDGAMRM